MAVIDVATISLISEELRKEGEVRRVSKRAEKEEGQRVRAEKEVLENENIQYK